MQIRDGFVQVVQVHVHETTVETRFGDVRVEPDHLRIVGDGFLAFTCCGVDVAVAKDLSRNNLFICREASGAAQSYSSSAVKRGGVSDGWKPFARE